MRYAISSISLTSAVIFLLGVGQAPASAGEDTNVIHISHDDRTGGGYLGVQLTDLTPELRTHFGLPADAGVMVSKVLEESPADRAGLQAGDIITAVNGHPVTSGGSLAHEIHGHEAGQTVDLEVWRDERMEIIGATLDERTRGHGHGLEAMVVHCPDDDSDCELELNHHPDYDCNGKQPCEVEVTCRDSDCECLVNGEPADCAELFGPLHPHRLHHQN